MAKRIWEDGQEQEVLEDYLDGFTFKELQNKYRASYGTIKRVLTDKGIEETNKKVWKKEDIEDIVHKYTKENYSLKQIRGIYRCRTETVGKILNSEGVNTSDMRAVRVNRTIDHNFFEKINTEEKAYYLGMLMADGCVRKSKGHRMHSISLELIDLDIVEKFKKSVGANSKITKSVRDRDYVKNERPTYTITIRSDKMAEDLRKHGVVPNKTQLIERLKLDIPEELERHYLRGLYDGDGSIYSCKKGRWFIALTNKHPGFLQDIQKIIRKHIPELGVMKIYKGDTSCRLAHSGRSAKKVIELLYNDSTISLNRKKKLADKAVEDIV